MSKSFASSAGCVARDTPARKCSLGSRASPLSRLTPGKWESSSELIGQSKTSCDFWRDVTLQEDRSQVRTRHVPALLALLNCTVLALMDLLGMRNVAARMHRYAARPWETLQLLLGTL